MIREMEPHEHEVVARLLLRANEEHLAVFPPAVAEGYRRELVDVQNRLRVADVYVAVAHDVIVGTVTLIEDSGHDAHPWPPGGSVLRLLAVDPTERGGGLGERLVGRCLAEAARRRRRFVGLHTAPAMATAKRLYERLGFERAPQHDFVPGAHYAGSADPSEEAWGEAYLLHFHSS